MIFNIKSTFKALQTKIAALYSYWETLHEINKAYKKAKLEFFKEEAFHEECKMIWGNDIPTGFLESYKLACRKWKDAQIEKMWALQDLKKM